jgi:DNA invertase Pin-like site-specific DNA recombinase
MKNFVYGYRRVSTDLQSLERQLAGVECDRYYDDIASGRNSDRPQLQRLLDVLQEGDTVIVHSIDRLARNTRDLLNLVETFRKNKWILKFHTENMVFNGTKKDPMQDCMLTMIGAVVTMENALIAERRCEGIRLAKVKGKYRGRVKFFTGGQLEQLKALYKNTLMSIGDIAKSFRCTKLTVSNTLKREKVFLKNRDRKKVFEENFLVNSL